MSPAEFDLAKMRAVAARGAAPHAAGDTDTLEQLTRSGVAKGSRSRAWAGRLRRDGRGLKREAMTAHEQDSRAWTRKQREILRSVAPLVALAFTAAAVLAPALTHAAEPPKLTLRL